MQFSKKVQACSLSATRKYYPYEVACREKGKKIYKINYGQPDIPTPREFFDAIAKFDEPVLSYAPSPGIPELIDAIQARFDKIGAHFEKDEIYVTAGGTEALQLIAFALLDEGDEIITPEPFYTNCSTFAILAGGKTVPVLTTAEEGYRYANREKLEAVVTPHTKAILVATPNNPTGVTLTDEEMRVIVDFAKDHDLFIIADEVYREFTFDRPQSSFTQFKDAEDRVILVDSISKVFSATGARVGAMMCKNKAFNAEILKLLQARLSVATLDQVGAAALYRLGDEFYENLRKKYKERRDVVYEELQKIPGVLCNKSEGAFYVTAKLPVDNVENFIIWMLDKFEDNNETVMISPASGFYQTEGIALDETRIAYVLEKDDLRRAIELLRLGIEQYNKR